jgi:O-antigen ligase
MQWGVRRAIFRAIRSEFSLGLLLTVACAGLLIVQRPDLGRAKMVILMIVCLFVAIIIQVPFAADQASAQNIFVDRVAKFACLTFFMMVLIQSPHRLTFFLYAFLLSCFYITQESVRGLISGGLVWENQGVMRLHGAVPIYRHPNSLAGLAMGAVTFVVFLLPVWRGWFLRCALLALLATSIICVLYSGSRTGYVGFLAFLIYWFAVSRRKARWLTFGLILGSIGLVFTPQQYKDRFLSIGGPQASGSKGGSGSRATRIEIQEDALAIFLENPAGIGVGSFPAVRMEKFGRFQDTHNLYLEVATNLGIQGLIVFLALIGAILSSYRKAYRRFREQQDSVDRALQTESDDERRRVALVGHRRDLDLLLAVCRAAGGFVLVRLVLGVFGMDLYEIYWWFAAGLALCLLNMIVPTSEATLSLVPADTEGRLAP